MRPLTCLLLLAAVPACPPGPGPTTATGATTTATSGETGASTGPTAPTTGILTTGGTTETTTLDTTDVSTATTAPLDITTTTTTTTADDTSSTTAADDTSTGPGPGALVIAIVDAELYADCKPRIDPDPVEGGWTVAFDNTGGLADTAATLVSASLSLADVDPPALEPILVEPTDSGPIPAGQQVDQNQDKLHGAMHSACDHCGEFYKLVLTYDEGGVMHVAEEDVTISCAL